MDEDEVIKAKIKLEWEVDAIISRLLKVNDAYGNGFLRHAILDELNGLKRLQNKCLLPTSHSESRTNTETSTARSLLPS